MTTVAEILAIAVQCHGRGNLQQAEQRYQQVLQMEPGQVHALHFLGVLNLQVGRMDLAVEYLGQAVSRQPAYAEAINNLGIALAAQGKLDEAVARYRDVLRLRPDFAEALNNLGLALAALKKYDEAVASYHQALQSKPGYAEAHCNLASVLGKQGKLDEAVRSCQEALRIRPNYPEAYSGLGKVLAAQGKLDEAEACFQQAVNLRADLVEAHVNLGVMRAAQERLDEAVASLEQALRFQPQRVEALNNLGVALERQGKLTEAAAFCQEAVRLKPDYADAYNNLGVILLGQGKPDEALGAFQQAVHIKPDFAEAHYTLGETLQEQGKLEEALLSWQQALSLNPKCAQTHTIFQGQPPKGSKPAAAGTISEETARIRATNRLRILQATQLPPIYQSKEEIQYWRKRLTEGVQQLRADQITHDLTREPAKPVFYLAYQGFNDRDIQRELARLYSAPREVTGPTAPIGGGGQGRIQVGILSCHLKRHTIGHLMRGLIANLARKELSVTVLSVGQNRDDVAQFIREHADRYLELPLDLQACRRKIAQLGLDVLFYTDIGMESTAYSLAFSRLAPVQCVTWGHPSTTGIDTIDYFLSSDLLEADDAAQHYTEKLVRFKSLPIYYYRPTPPSPLKERGNFGLSENSHVYACPQSLFKLHPEFDEILGGILREDPVAQIVLLHGRSRHWDEMLRKRFSTTIADVVERIHFVPPQSREDFLSLNAAADVLLDPIHFGGGNTTYEGLALGIPIVTLPSRFLRGRITLALYKQMEVLDCVAANPAEYIRIAVKLGTDPEYRALIRSRIVTANEALYENREGIRELEQFFQEAVARARSR
jgi:predicted O-linked N-acetylglucosamine transferase (SPINDLY family)